MKKLAKVLSLALVLVMVLSLGGTAWAEDPTTVTTGSISISNTKTDHTYEAYQIFGGDLVSDGSSLVLSNIKWGTGVRPDMSGFSWTPVTGTTLTTANAVADYLAGLSGTDASAAADAFATYLKTNNYLSSYNSGALSEGKYTIDNLDPGYYLVVDKEGELGENANDVYSDYIVQVVGNVTNIVPKGDIPSLDKQVADNDAGDNTSAAATNPTNKNPGSGWYESADHKINESFQFKLLATIPASVDLADYPTYEIVFNDVMSTGVTFESIESVQIKDAEDASFSTVPAEKYTPSENIYVSGEGKYKPLDGNGTTAWTLTINNVKTAVANLDFTQDITIEVIYNAHLNANAPVLKVTGNDASENTSYITYSNNPNANTKGKSPEDHVWVFTYEVDNIKVDGANKTDVTNTVKADTTLKNEIDGVAPGSTYTHTDGQVYIKEGDTYYELPALADAGFTLKDSGNNDVNLIWDDSKGAYRPATAAEIAETGYSAEMKSQANGKFNIIGLDAGTYTLEETTVPAGYNKAQNITVTIGATHKENDDQGSAAATLTNTNTKNTIVNYKGNQLPSTGGVGTTLFYVFGSMLVIAAAVYFVTKKRSEVE